MADRLLVGTRKGLFRIERDGGGQWRSAFSWFLGDPVSLGSRRARRPAVACGLGPGSLRCQATALKDGGGAWSEAAVPAFPPKPEGVKDKDPMRGLDLPWATRLIWALEVGGPGELWCGVIPGGLFRSMDGGET